MICKTCGSEFDIENFDVCPYCLSPFECLNADLSVEIENLNSTNADMPILEEKEMTADVEATLKSEVTEEVENIDKGDSNKKDSQELPIDCLNLSARAYNVLRRNGVESIGDLVEFASKNNLFDLRNAGVKTVEEIYDAISRYESGEVPVTHLETEPTENSEIEIYPFSNMSSDVENLSITAFSELGLATQSVNILLKHGWKVCKDLKNVSAPELIRVLRKNNYDRVLQVAECLEKDIIEITQKVLDETANTRDARIFLRRAAGDTLQFIADNPGAPDDIPLTRERVRQIERKYGNKVIPFVKVLIELLMGSNEYISVQDLLDLYDNDDYDRIIIHAGKLLSEYQYLDFADMFVKKKSDNDIEFMIMQPLGEMIGSGIDLSNEFEEIYSLLEELGLGYLDIDSIKNLLRKCGYKTYCDYVSKGKASYGQLCMEIIKKHFSAGIKLSQSDVEQAEDLIKLRELVKETYGDIELPISDRALSSTLTRSGLVLRGRGMYIPAECIEIDENILFEIKQSIDSKLNDRVFYSELYSEFEGILNFTCGIDNYNYLHGILMCYYPTEYEYSRDYLLKNGTPDSSAMTIADRLYAYICEVGRPVSKNELMKKFQGFTNIMLMTPFVNDERLLQWEYNSFSCTGILDVTQSDKERLHQVLVDILNENNGYSSDAMFYERVKVEYPEFLHKNKMSSDMNLYYVVSKLFDNCFDFKRPHIGMKGKFDRFSTKDVVLHMMGYPEELSFEKYKIVAEKMAWSPVTVGIVFGEIEKGYLRISSDKYIKESVFDIPESAVLSIREKIDILMEDGILSLINLDFDDWPEINYPWNEFLIETLIRRLYGDMMVIQPSIKDRRYQKGIAVLKEINVNNYPQLVAYVMKKCGVEKMTESSFLSFLVVHNLTKKMIPAELNNSDYIVKDIDTYIIVK